MGSLASPSTGQSNDPRVASPPRWFVWGVRIFGSLGVLSAVLGIGTGDPLAGLLQLTWVMGVSGLMVGVVPPGRLLTQIERHAEPLLILVIVTLACHAVVQGTRDDWLNAGLLITAAVVALYRYGTVRGRMSAYAELKPIYADIDVAFDQMFTAVCSLARTACSTALERNDLATALEALQEKLARLCGADRRRGRPEKVTPDQIFEAVARFRAKHHGETPTQEAIAEELEIHPNTLQNCLRRADKTWTSIIS